MFSKEKTCQFSLKAYMKAYAKREDHTITIIEHGEPVYLIELDAPSEEVFSELLWDILSASMFAKTFESVNASEAGEIIIKMAEELGMYDVCHKYL